MSIIDAYLSEKYQLNHQAFAQHSANFRQSVVVTTVSQLGIGDIGQSLRQAEPFRALVLAGCWR